MRIIRFAGKALIVALALLALGRLAAQSAGAVPIVRNPEQPLPGTEIPLWMGEVPDAKGSRDADRPVLLMFLPNANPTRTAVVIAPGGGYRQLSMQKEGEDIARWLNARGVAAFVLRYRLGPVYHHPVELNDARRAVRLVRTMAGGYGIDPDKVGMWGFSAGGHLAATAGTMGEPGNPASADLVERQPSRPSFLVLTYPVITLEDPVAHKGSRTYLLGDSPDPALVTLLSAEKRVDAQTPPTFLFATTDDPVVPVMNSIEFYAALVANKVPAEMHLYQHGPHGVGLAPGFPDLKGWPDLLATWMRARGYMGPD